jgi:hypothetical protein
MSKFRKIELRKSPVDQIWRAWVKMDPVALGEMDAEEANLADKAGIGVQYIWTMVAAGPHRKQVFEEARALVA